MTRGTAMKEQFPSFERPILEVEERIEALRLKAVQTGTDRTVELRRLKKRADRLKRDIYAKLNRWQRTQVARHPNRPLALDYIQGMTTDFVELHGDRIFGDDPAVVVGLARFEGQAVVMIGQQKGRDTRDRVLRNFGMPHPEGYRKALRLMRLAETFQKPIITLVDTPGAYPGIGAEERGQAEAIARNLLAMTSLTVPLISVIIGEGGSGGALALAMGNRVLMLEHAIYSVISPEGCAAILWENQEKAQEAAEALRLSAKDLLEFGIVDEVVKEPLGGAHRDPSRSAAILRRVLRRHLRELTLMPPEKLAQQRFEKFRRMGTVLEH